MGSLFYSHHLLKWRVYTLGNLRLPEKAKRSHPAILTLWFELCPNSQTLWVPMQLVWQVPCSKRLQIHFLMPKEHSETLLGQWATPHAMWRTLPKILAASFTDGEKTWWRKPSLSQMRWLNFGEIQSKHSKIGCQRTTGMMQSRWP